MYYLVIESEPPKFIRSTSVARIFDEIQTTSHNWLLSNEPCLDDNDEPMKDEQYEIIQ